MRTLQEVIAEDLGECLYTVQYKRDSNLERYLIDVDSVIEEMNKGMFYQLADKLREKGELIVHSKELPELGQIESTLKAVVVPPYEILHLVERCIRELSIEQIHEIKAVK